LEGPEEVYETLFHFNSRTEDKLLPDEEGQFLPDREAARRFAMTSARETLLEAVSPGKWLRTISS
jgi:hypothetical protein